jgi:sulfur carrier protein
MIITFNGAPHEVASSVLADLLVELGVPSRGSAAAVDGEVVPRSGWATFTIEAGQAVEILTAVQGG